MERDPMPTSRSGRARVVVDGTRVEAVNSKDRNFTTGSLQKFIGIADKKLEDNMKQLDAGDAGERETDGSRVELYWTGLRAGRFAKRSKNDRYAKLLSFIYKLYDVRREAIPQVCSEIFLHP
jgi:hypothetical protein